MPKINVILFRGLAGNVYSTGMDVLAMRLKKLDFIDYVAVSPYTDWRGWASRIKYFMDKTALVGHSYGVTAALGVAQKLNGSINIPLVVSYDPSQYYWMSWSLRGANNVVPPNVKNAINFYQDGYGMIGGQTLKRADGSARGISNNLLHSSHTDIEDMPLLHDKTEEELRKVAA